MARQTVFFSHETYTPARGGSASAEAAALRRAFGPAAKDVVIANTKGFTGHPMGAGIEDAIALKALQYGEVPPIPNLKELDPDFSDLTLSSGGPRACRFAVRLAAGFGSQVALTVWEREAVGDERVVDARARDAWLRQVTGFADAALVVEDRTLRAIEGDPVAAAAPAPAAPTPAPASPRATSTPAPAVDRPASAPRAPRGLPPGVDVLDVLLDVVSAHTGYARSELDPDFELEADLGVDTVKQAEILSSLRERLDLARDDGFRLADHPTLRALAGWADARLRVIAPLDATLADEPTEHRPPPSFSSSQVATVPPAPRASDVPTGPPASPRVVEPTVTSATPDPGATTERPGPERLSAPVRPRHDVYGLLAEIVATHTGYAVTDLDPEFELEADLGVDTVKQAEILSEARKQLGLGPLDLRLADHPSLGALAAFLAGRLSEPAHPALADVPEAVEPPPDVSPQPVEDDGPPSGVALRVPVTAPIGEARGAPLHGRAVKVLGWGPVADAIRRRLLERGAVEHEPADLVVDAGLDADGLLVEAQLRADAPPARWICVVAQGDDLIQAGARAGFTKALGREWTTTEVRVVDLRGGADEIARLVAIEASAPGPVEVRYEGGVRRGVRYAVVPAPEPGDAEGKVVVITGGARGVGAEIAAELARRGARLALVGRTAPSEAPFDEEAERERVRTQLSARGKRVTPVQVEARLAPLRAAGEVRAALDRLPGSTYHVADLGDPTRVPALVEEIRAAHGRIDALIHGAGFEDSRALADKRSDAVSTALAPKALALDALLTALPEVRALAMGSVAGRFGNAGQVDYAAANDAMARRTLAHPRGLSVAWTAWGDVGMATRGSLPRLLEERGVELLRATDGARIAADLLLSDVTGEVVVAGRLGPFTHATGHPMVRSVRLDGPSVSAELPLDLASAPWLEDHAIDGTPVLPGVVGLEWMAAVATELGGEAPIAARDVRFRTPLKVHPGSTPVVRVVAWDDDGPVARLSSTRTLANGREQTVHHFQARFDAVLSTEALPSAFLPDEALDFDAIYRRFFHGPAFRVLARVDGLASDGLVATARVPPGGLPDGLGFAPLVIEAAFQAAGLLHLATTGNDALPAGIALVEILGAATPDDDLTVTVAAAGGRYDVDVDGSGGPVVRLRGLVLAERGPAAPDRRLDAGPGGRPPGFEGYGGVTAGPRVAVATAPEIACWRLSRATLDAIDARGAPVRRRDRRVGRVAVGRALSAVGAPEDVENDVAGRPIAVGASVSLSHRDGRAVAVAARGPVGIDLERIEVRSRAFLEDWLTDDERARVGADPVRQTAVWSTKESVLKLLGAGLALDARDVDVEVGAPGATRVTLRGAARARWQAAGAPPIAASWRRLDADYVVTVATSEPDQTLRR
jgi:NAD(P)-dependent dehydrogenase (short-subunit alcohol dehydrogenase family)/4'-phosphopantetheinyl transferase EntD/3-hydroxymyristoyl/3-hydroxydecanoyl-(acyl carrier protein) dehydratase/acyl carrier protein